MTPVHLFTSNRVSAEACISNVTILSFVILGHSYNDSNFNVLQCVSILYMSVSVAAGHVDRHNEVNEHCVIKVIRNASVIHSQSLTNISCTVG